MFPLGLHVYQFKTPPFVAYTRHLEQYQLGRPERIDIL